ncbi:C-GCAxxG-C-C family (seleno)protein [Oceanispirochaeta sp.]|jgi:C_GCAxxG_C_C family probable redox protein|uniref:C-GCAxxG-C-C family (seleno)protein n=1 Tax=Oceanispirochaeta sp. TaxID=2035350 RepID=UPI002634A9BF|nr:C-GCAxxG-C-C family (seleno)protein [Oceanispirochaeta sp.]MDA3957705.1 C-GCAxxG-C-C family protein [Oceanispirochaeta sp.]
MLKEYIENGFGLEEDFSCSETILYGANQVWNLGLSKKALKMSAGLSAGCYSDNICGALSAATMVLSALYIRDRAHEGSYNDGLVKELIDNYRKLMGSELCAPLKTNHRTEKEKCRPVIIAAAGVLDQIIAREGLPEGD